MFSFKISTYKMEEFLAITKTNSLGEDQRIQCPPYPMEQESVIRVTPNPGMPYHKGDLLKNLVVLKFKYESKIS